MVIKHFGKRNSETKELFFYNKPLYELSANDIGDDEFVLTIQKKPKRVSQDQHGYYRGGVIATALEFELFKGWTAKEVHTRLFQPLFLTYKESVKSLVGEETVYIESTEILSTADLNRKQMAEFIDNCIRWLAEHGIVVLDSSQYLIEKYK